MTETLSPKTDWKAVWYGVSLGVLASLQQFKLPPAMPLMLSQYGYGKTLAGSFMSVYAVAGLLVSIPVGKRLAAKGPMGLLSAAFAVFLAGNALALLLPESGAAMFASRALEGLGFTILAVTGAVIATLAATPGDRPVAVALWASWIPAGQIIATLIAIPSVFAGLWRPLWIGSILATVGLWALGYALYKKGSETLRPPRQAAPRPKDQAGDEASGKGKGYLLFIASLHFGLWSGQYITFVTWLPQYMVEVLGIAPSTAARAYLIPCVMVIPLTLYGARLLRNGASISTLLTLSTAVQAVIWFLIPVTRSPWAGALSLALYGATSGITATAIFSVPGALMGKEASKAFAAMMAGRNFGVLVGPVLLAQAVTMAGNWSFVPYIFGSACLVCLAIGLHLCAGMDKHL